MKKAALLSALLLGASTLPAFAQIDIEDENDEGRPHLYTGPDRAVTKACRAEATQRNLSGKERRQFINACQKEEPMSSSGASSGGRTMSPMRDADGRFPPTEVAPSHFAREGPSSASSRPAIPDLDAEGRPRPH